ncbi:hypothetical protein OG756_41535 (plasmid) [Streptomyces sp. NBC_01310]|uniref:hypothetical protein n=1 Tax=Streptomyces TaxID=1883 RepID=UPI00224C8F76|nr:MULTISPECIES: hypothetical protein [Streptomyces]MCX5278043.1 hypothetical protein [Streptomyces virginiae]WSJ64502.1 hypothetical protein OG756_41535 [Streptomyces sp. NBC_01310]
MRHPAYAHIDDLLGPYPANVSNLQGHGLADFPRWVLPFLAAQVAEEAEGCPETTTVDLLPDGRVVERAPAAFAAEGYEDQVVTANSDGTYTVGADWWWYAMDARAALRSSVQALIRPGARHRRFRAMVAVHAASTLAASGIMAARDRLISRLTER